MLPLPRYRGSRLNPVCTHTQITLPNQFAFSDSREKKAFTSYFNFSPKITMVNVSNTERYILIQPKTLCEDDLLDGEIRRLIADMS